MTNKEIALGVIESAVEAGIGLDIDGDTLIVSYRADSTPDDVLARLIRECRADIVEAMRGDSGEET